MLYTHTSVRVYFCHLHNQWVLCILISMTNQSFLAGAFGGAIAGALITFLTIQTQLPEALPLPDPAAPTLPASSLEDSHERSVIETVQAAQSAVVSIVITQDVPIIEQFFEEVPGPFGSFPFQVPRLRQNGTERQEVGGGSGFLISDDGLIVTNRHVVDQEEAQYTVFLSDGSKHEATVEARDPVNDIAILRISGGDFPSLEFADSDALQVGQTVIAIGNALGEFTNSVSVGVVSGLSRSIRAGNSFGQSEQLDEVIQTDAAINPGNSGGPLLDLTGKVIGVNVAVAQGSENIGFALPANIVNSVVESVQVNGRIIRPYLGIRYAPITTALQEANNLSIDYGVLVVRGDTPDQLAVVPGSPANKAGIVEGDIILEIDGQRLDFETSLASIVRQKNVGDTINLKVLSGGEVKTVSLTLEEFPE